MGISSSHFHHVGLIHFGTLIIWYVGGPVLRCCSYLKKPPTYELTPSQASATTRKVLRINSNHSIKPLDPIGPLRNSA